MHKTLWMLGLTIIVLLSACQGKPPQANLTEDESAVYTAILEGSAKINPDLEYVILSETLCCSHISISDDYAFQTVSVAQEVLDTYRAANQQSWLIEPRLDIPVPYTMRTQEELDAILDNDSFAGWKKFTALYPQAPGYVAVSRIGFDSQMTHALVWVEVHGGPNTSFSSICTPYKSDSGWVQGTCHPAP